MATHDPSPLARKVMRALNSGPATPEALALATHLPAGVVDVVLAELRNAGLIDDLEHRLVRLRASS